MWLLWNAYEQTHHYDAMKAASSSNVSTFSGLRVVSMQVWQGYRQSLRAGDGILTLNIDMACTAFLQQDPVSTFLVKSANLVNDNALQGMAERDVSKAQKAIRGLKVGVLQRSPAFCPPKPEISKSRNVLRAVPFNSATDLV